MSKYAELLMCITKNRRRKGPEISRRMRFPGFKTIVKFRWKSFQPYAPPLYPQEIFLGHSATVRIMSMKISNDNSGKRTRNLPACSAMPQSAAPPRGHLYNACTMHDTCNASGLGIIPQGFKLLCIDSSHFISLKMATWLAETCSEVTGYIYIQCCSLEHRKLL